jgi:hypothetical protein
MLALQRSAGNQAVSALVARSPAGDKKDSKKATGLRATLSDIGTIQLFSAQLPASGLGRGDRQPPLRELHLSSLVGEHTPALVKAAMDGKPMEVEVIFPAMHLKLAGAVVSSYSNSGGGEPESIENWALNFQAMKQTGEEGEGAKP